ncbi:hypothetical protein ASZ90_001124 [hydrocarbon metagenome]|uniref:Uncharacterized protein n=1 Tax=hydrocarbon metagenome TaxID=938273 RepID=A0A0W8G770_9ZZZZ
MLRSAWFPGVRPVQGEARTGRTPDTRGSGGNDFPRAGFGAAAPMATRRRGGSPEKGYLCHASPFSPCFWLCRYR